MARKKKPQKPLLSEGSIRRFMKLADIPELSESYFSEKQGYDDEEDESLGMRTGKEADKEQSEKDRRDDSYGKWGKRDETLAEEDEEAELEATEDELGAEDEVADEEGAELDAEAGNGEAEITPEAAQAIVDLAASLEASGAVEAAEEVEAGEEEMEAGAEEIEGGEELEGLEEALAGLGIQVVDDSPESLKEQVYKRVMKRLVTEQKKRKKEQTVNKLVDNIFARIQKSSKRRKK